MSVEEFCVSTQEKGSAISRERSVSLPLFQAKEKSNSTFQEEDTRPPHSQSYDSLLSLDKSSSFNLDSSSQMSLPELNNTLVDSEGYASFRSNPSSSSSPWSSSQNSPTGENDRLDNSLETEIEDNCDSLTNVEQSNGICHHENDEEDVIGTQIDKTKCIPVTDSQFYSKLRNPTEIVSADNEKTTPLSLDIAKRMSTIDEDHEDTPSPRSIIDIDRTFLNVYKNICDKERLAYFNENETGVSSSIENDLEEEENYVKGITDDQMKRQIVVKRHSNAEIKIESDAAAVKSDKRGMLSKAESQSSAPNEESETDKDIPARVVEFDAKIDPSTLGEQAFDIDLDLYDIPKEKRQPLETKLQELRTFVERIIDDRRSLEQDRLSLQRILALIRSKEGTAFKGVMEERGEMTFTFDSDCQEEQSDVYQNFLHNINSKVLSNERCQESCIGNGSSYANNMQHSCTGFSLCVKEGQSEVEDKTVEVSNDDELDYEELLSSLEDALMENIGLKNENQDLSTVNNELRKQIEDLLTQEEELRYKINRTTMKLMEDVGRQKEENVVLRSNFNKVLRDYNELEIEFEELKENYEELICERDVLVDEIAIKNEDYNICRNDCEQLAEELDAAKKQLEQYDMAQEKVWTREDWENLTVLQTKVSITEKALLDARKQKALLIGDLKTMRKKLEMEGQRIHEAEAAMDNLEINLRQAYEKNKSLRRENDELRWSILVYEAKLTELSKNEGVQSDRAAPFDRFAEEHSPLEGSRMTAEGLSPKTDVKDSSADNPPKETAPTNNEISNNTKTANENSVVLRKDSKSNSFRRARTFPINEMESLALRFCQETQPDFYAGSHYQNAFQEIVDLHEEEDDDKDDNSDGPLTIKVSARYDNNHLEEKRLCSPDLVQEGPPTGCISSENLNRKLPHRYTCLPLRLVLPTLMQSLLHSKSKRGKRPEPPD
eukprot:gene15349-6581_t